MRTSAGRFRAAVGELLGEDDAALVDDAAAFVLHTLRPEDATQACLLTALYICDGMQKRDRRAPEYAAAAAALKARIGSVAPARLAELTDYADLFAQHIDAGKDAKRGECVAALHEVVLTLSGTWRRRGRWNRNLALVFVS